MEFQSRDVERITGVKNKRLWAWIDRGFIVPSIQQAEGPGTRNIWSRNDLYSIAIFKKLSESGWAKKLIADYMQMGIIPSEITADGIKYVFFVREGERVESALISADSMDVEIPRIVEQMGMEGFESIFIINFKKIKRQVDLKV